MRKIKYMALTAVSLFVLTMGVNAEDVTDFTKLKACLEGTETICKVTDNITTTAAITLTGDIDKTLDLNGKDLNLAHTITITGGYSLKIINEGNITGNDVDPMIEINDGGDLEIEKATVINNTNDGITLNVIGKATDATGIDETTLVIKKDATIKGNYPVRIGYTTGNASYGVRVKVYGEVTGITGNNGFNHGVYALYVNGNVKPTTGNIPVIEIYDGAVIKGAKGTVTDVNLAAGPAVYAAGYAKWIIKGGSFEGCEALSIKSGIFEITGGTFKATGNYVDPYTVFNNGTETTGAAISITNSGDYPKNVEITIDNAEVISEKGIALFEGNNDQTSAGALKSISVKGGNFAGREGAVQTSKDGFIEGGTFEGEVAEEDMKQGLEKVEIADGVFVVGVKHNITVNEAKKGKATVDKDLAVEGEKVTITTTPDKGYKLKGIKVVNVATKEEIDLEENTFIMPDASVEVTVEFELNVKNPDTSDNIMTTFIMGTVSLLSLATVAIYLKKRTLCK